MYIVGISFSDCFIFTYCSVSLSLGNNWQFAFNVKFYPPEPSLLTEDITRYMQTHCTSCKHKDDLLYYP